MFNMKFALGTTNKAKEKAVREWSESEGIVDFELNCVKVESGVSDMPMSDEECIDGAINRAKNSLLEDLDAEYGIGMEGGVSTINDTMFLCGWVAIVNREGKAGIGCSGHIEVPDSIRVEIENGKELGPLLGEMHERDVRNNEGAWGIFTNGRITRSDSFLNSLTFAFAKFDSDLY
jgi:inosine/xanthosine triphosphatase